jgi:asparagine synthase (glutamine-hydrolysing)
MGSRGCKRSRSGNARQQKLVLVRDRFGEKPLFYAERGGDLLFASELDALLAGMNREPELDSASIDAFVVLGYLPESTSIVRGAKQLPPDHVLSWERRSKRVHVEPSWAPGTWSAPTGRVEFEELVAETGRLVGRSVCNRLIADVPVGVLMSGGLKSTLIAALAATVSDKPVKTFTIRYEPEAASGMEETRRTAQALGTRHQTWSWRASRCSTESPPYWPGWTSHLRITLSSRCTLSRSTPVAK